MSNGMLYILKNSFLIVLKVFLEQMGSARIFTILSIEMYWLASVLSASILSKDLPFPSSNNNFSHLAGSVYRLYAPPLFNYSPKVVMSSTDS